MTRSTAYSLIALIVMAACAQAADLSVSREDVLYDETGGRLEITVHLADAAALAPFTVTAADAKRGLKAQRVVDKADGKTAACKLDWPRTPLASTITVTVQSKAAEPDASNNAVAVTMADAIRRDFIGYAGFMGKLADLKTAKLAGLKTTELEAEDFAAQKNVRVEEAKGASKGKAVRMLNRMSRIECDVTLDEGMYVYYTIAMAMAGDQDALRVTLGHSNKRGVLVPHRQWVRQHEVGLVRLRQGTHKLTVYYDEPNVLVDKVVVVKVK